MTQTGRVSVQTEIERNFRGLVAPKSRKGFTLTEMAKEIGETGWFWIRKARVYFRPGRSLAFFKSGWGRDFHDLTSSSSTLTALSSC